MAFTFLEARPVLPSVPLVRTVADPDADAADDMSPPLQQLLETNAK